MRFYYIEAGHDLLGDFIIRFNYGRIGSKGQTKTHVVQSADEGRKIVRECLKRRKSAPKRIGVAYSVYSKHDPDNWGDF